MSEVASGASSCRRVFAKMYFKNIPTNQLKIFKQSNTKINIYATYDKDEKKYESKPICSTFILSMYAFNYVYICSVSSLQRYVWDP